MAISVPRPWAETNPDLSRMAFGFEMAKRSATRAIQIKLKEVIGGRFLGSMIAPAYSLAHVMGSDFALKYVNKRERGSAVPEYNIFVVCLESAESLDSQATSSEQYSMTRCQFSIIFIRQQATENWSAFVSGDDDGDGDGDGGDDVCMPNCSHPFFSVSVAWKDLWLHPRSVSRDAEDGCLPTK